MKLITFSTLLLVLFAITVIAQDAKPNVTGAWQLVTSAQEHGPANVNSIARLCVFAFEKYS